MSDVMQDDHQWWLAPEFAKHDPMLSCVRYIRTHQTARKVNDLRNFSMYEGCSVAGFGYGTAIRRPSNEIEGARAGHLSLNVCRNMVGAATSKIGAKNKPKPMFLTDNGDYELRQKAKNLDKFVEGVFYDSGVYAELSRCFRNACVFGTGALKILDVDGKVDVQNTLPLELVVDDAEGASGDPPNLYHRKYYDRLVLRELVKEWLADNPEQLERALAVLSTRQATTLADDVDVEFACQTTADQVLVTEGWHRAPTRKAKGRHVIVIAGCTLVDEEWDGPFPFAFMRWTPPLEGFFGMGLVEELLGVQREINKLLRQIQRGQHLITGHYLVEHGAKVVAAQINNDLAAIVKYTGTKPEYVAPSIIAPEVYNHLWQLYAKAFEIAGISQLSATGMKPAGLDSGEAQRVYNDIQTERYLEVGQAYEDLVVEAARQVVRCAKRIGGGYKVKAVNGSGVDIIDWADVHIEEDLYVIRVYPTSMLPSTPAGKLAWIQDMIKGQIMPIEDILDAVDFPDVEAFKKRKLAPRRIIERNIAHMLKTGEGVSPEPTDNHKLALQLVNEAYAEARLDEVPEKKLELLRRYMTDTQDFIGPEPAGPVAPMVPPLGAPIPPPGAPPPMPPAPMPMAA